MSKEEYIRIIKEIEALPTGGITYKKINGKKYAYYQWREGGKQRSKRVKDDELEVLATKIARRKELQALLKNVDMTESIHEFNCAVRTGSELDQFVDVVKNWKKRECYKEL